MNHDVIISCAVTGDDTKVTKSPHCAITPEQIAATAIAAANAGAAIVHIHVRDPETGAFSMETRHYREVVKRIRESKVDVIVNLTCGMGGYIVVGENGRISQINFIRYKDDITLDAGPKPERGFVKAKIYVIAANAIETPRLLLMSKNGGRTNNGVANSSDMVGRNLMDHPYYVAWGLLPPTAKPVFPYRGPLITSGIGDLCDGPFRAKRAAFRVDSTLTASIRATSSSTVSGRP